MQSSRRFFSGLAHHCVVSAAFSGGGGPEESLRRDGAALGRVAGTALGEQIVQIARLLVPWPGV